MIPEILKIRQNETKGQANKLLNRTGKCAILRPAGFGKTYIIANIIAEEERYTRVLYIYPMETVKIEAEQDLEKAGNQHKVDFITYRKLSRINGDIDRVNSILRKYDLIVFDELHHMGAKQAKNTIEAMLERIDPMKTNIIGGTATPDRMDGFDIIDRFFDNSLVDEYLLDDAISDKIFLKPHYVYGPESNRVVMDALEKRYKKVDNSALLLKKAEIAMANIINAPLIINNAVDSVYRKGTPSYMRWLVFFSDKKILHTKCDEVEAWFKVAYNNDRIKRNIRVTIVHSDVEYRNNITKLRELGEPKDTIDIIICINMLNEGYHMDSVTGVILLRPTQSSAVYVQQVGRSMSVSSKNRPIVIDLVDNYTTKPLFGIDTTPAKTVKTFKEQINNLNRISKENITIKDVMADVKKVIKKLDQQLDLDVEKDILEKRTISHMSVSTLHSITGIPVYKILSVLTKNNISLLETEKYVWNNEGPTEELLEGYQEYFNRHINK